MRFVSGRVDNPSTPLVSKGRPMGDTVHQRRWWILGVLCLSLLIIVVDNSILNVALPTLARPVSQGGLDATTSQLQWMVDAYTLVFAGLLLTAGSLRGRFGRRGALQVGLTVFGLGSLLSAMASPPRDRKSGGEGKGANRGGGRSMH